MYDQCLLFLHRAFVSSTRSFHATSHLHRRTLFRSYRCYITRPALISTRTYMKRSRMVEDKDKSQHHSQHRQMHDTANADGNDEQPNEDWKYRAPYRKHESSDGFKAIYTGQCHCGQVKFELNRDQPLACKYCHCVDCQVQHGMSRSLLNVYRSSRMVCKRFMLSIKTNRTFPRRSFPMGGHLPQRRHQFPSRP
jgi:hypothetical protein